MPCNHDYIYTDHSKVCTECGVETPVLRLDTYSKCSAPLNRGYDRGCRFRIKLMKLFGMHSGPKYEDPVWKMLHAIQDELHTPRDVRKRLRGFKLKNKHYDSTRIFTDTFTPFRVAVPFAAQVRERIQQKFRAIHSSWRAYTPHESFFSYDFLLRLLLVEEKCPLVVYCKPPTSKRRRTKYMSKLAIIRSRSGYRMSSRMIVVPRFQNVLVRPSIHRSLPPLVEDLVELGEGDRSKHNAGRKGGRAPYRKGSSGKRLGGSGLRADACALLRWGYRVSRRGLKGSDTNIYESRRENVVSHPASS
jgi:hypothetical protein